MDIRDFKKLKIKRKFSSTGMNKFQKMVFLIDRTQRIIHEHDVDGFILSMHLREKCKGKGVDAHIAEINEFVSWEDV